jgi:hypothetical protein
MARTDIHSPKNLVTEDYTYIGSGCFSDGTGGPGFSPDIGHLVAQGITFAENEFAGDCYHCGARLNYFALLLHEPTQKIVRVGEQCRANRFDRATEDFRRLRKQTKLNREQAIRTERRATFDAQHSDVAEELARHEGWLAKRNLEPRLDDGFMSSLCAQFARKGELSEAQIAAVRRGIERREDHEAKRAELYAKMPPPSPCPEGRVEVTGLVLSVKTKVTAYGVREVMTVVDDRGFKVWGSVPQAIFDGCSAEDRTAKEKQGIDICTVNTLAGRRVSFTARVEPSDHDKNFGFLKRPTRGKLEPQTKGKS